MDHRQHKASSNRWRCMADRKDLSIGSESSPHPLKEQKFFIHLSRICVDEKELEEIVERLGGKVEKFFTNEVTCVLTDDKSVVRPSIRSNFCWTAAHPDMCIIDSNEEKPRSLAEATASKTCDTNDEGDPNNAVIETEKVERLAGTVNRLGHLRVPTTASKEVHAGIVHKANMLGIRVCHVKDFLMWIKSQNGVKRVQSNNTSKPKKPHRAPNRKRMVHKLCGPIIKVEDTQSIYKPFYKELKKDPALLLEPYHTGSPYDDLEAIHACLPVKKQRDAKIKLAPETSKCIKPPQVQPKNQYCECCREFFCDLPKHLNSDKHQEFVSQQHNFECLKEFVDCFPSNGPPALTKIKIELPSSTTGLPESPPTDSPQSETVVIKTEPTDLEESKISDPSKTHMLPDTQKNFKLVPVESPLQLKLPLCAPVNVNVFPTPSPSSSPLQCVNALCKKEDSVTAAGEASVPPSNMREKEKLNAAFANDVGMQSSPLNAFMGFSKVFMTQSIDPPVPFLPFPGNGTLLDTNKDMPIPSLEPDAQSSPPDFLSSPIPIDDLPSPPSDTPVLLEWPDIIEPCETKVAHDLSSSSFAPGNATLSQGLPSISHFGQEQELFKCSAENMFSSESSDNNMTGDIQNILDDVLFNLHDKQVKEQIELAAKLARADLEIAHLEEPAQLCDGPDNVVIESDEKNDDYTVPDDQKMMQSLEENEADDPTDQKPVEDTLWQAANEEHEDNHDTGLAMDVDEASAESTAKISDELLESPNLPEPSNVNSDHGSVDVSVINDQQNNPSAAELINHGCPNASSDCQFSDKPLRRVAVDGDDQTSETNKTADTSENNAEGSSESTTAAKEETEEKGSEGGSRDPPCLLSVEQQFPTPETQDQNCYQPSGGEPSTEPPMLEQVSLQPPCNSKEWTREKRWSEDKDPPVLQKVTQWPPVCNTKEESDPDDPYRFVDEDAPPQKESRTRQRRRRRNLRNRATTFKRNGRSRRRTHTRALRRACAAQITIPVYSSKRRLGLPRGRLMNESANEKICDSSELKKDHSDDTSGATFRWHVHRIQGTKLIIRRSLVTDKL